MKKIGLIIVIIIIMLTFVSCSNDEERIIKNTNNLQEITLPDGTENITSIKTDSSGNLFISTMKTNDEESCATATLWKLKKSDKWEKLFEKEFVSEPSENVIKNANIEVIGEKGVISEYNFDKGQMISYKANMYVLNSLHDTEIIEKFDSLTGHLFARLYGSGVENVFGFDYDSFEIIRINFLTGEMQEIDVLGDIVEMCCHGNNAYVIYRQDYELTEKEIASLTPNSDFPERYARGVIYDMDSGSITESEALDKLALRLFQKWHEGGENADNYPPIYYPAIGYDKEAYYLAHNDGVYRIDEDGEELICYDESWESKKNCLEMMTVAENGDIYLSVCLNNYEEVKLYRIKS